MSIDMSDVKLNLRIMRYNDGAENSLPVSSIDDLKEEDLSSEGRLKYQLAKNESEKRTILYSEYFSILENQRERGKVDPDKAGLTCGKPWL